MGSCFWRFDQVKNNLELERSNEPVSITQSLKSVSRGYKVPTFFMRTKNAIKVSKNQPRRVHKHCNRTKRVLKSSSVEGTIMCIDAEYGTWFTIGKGDVTVHQLRGSNDRDKIDNKRIPNNQNTTPGWVSKFWWRCWEEKRVEMVWKRLLARETEFNLVSKRHKRSSLFSRIILLQSRSLPSTMRPRTFQQAIEGLNIKSRKNEIKGKEEPKAIFSFYFCCYC